MTYTTVTHCGTDHSHWLKELSAYDEELDVLEKRLLEIVQKNNTKEVMAGVEHFQNQFIVQRNNIDELQHHVHEHDHKVATDVQAHAGKMEQTSIAVHDTLKEQMEIFKKVFAELREEYNRFLSIRM